MIGKVENHVALNPANPVWLLMAVVLFLFGPGMAVGQESGPASAELRALYEADQADRQFSAPPTPEQWEEITARDAQRQARVYELLRADQLTVAEDFFHAAMVLQHGEKSEPILVAHVLATAAAYMGDDRGRWLSAAALDRYLDLPRFCGHWVSVAPETGGTQVMASPAFVRQRANTETGFRAALSITPLGLVPGPCVRMRPDSDSRGWSGAAPDCTTPR